jgi:hypothetical protein
MFEITQLLMNNFSPAWVETITWQNCYPGVEISTVLAGLKILSCNRAFDFDGVLYYIQGWNLNPVKWAEFNPGVENASFNRPLKTLIPEEIIVCPGRSLYCMSNCLWVKLYVYIEPRQPRYQSYRPKKYLWFRFPNRPYFFLPTLLFFRCG